MTDEYLVEKKNAYLAECERMGAYDWRYYYIKYAEFRPRRYGKYLWGDYWNKPYEMSVLWTASKESENAYQPFLRAIGEVDRNDLGRRIVCRHSYIRAQNDCYAAYDLETGAEIARLTIPQNDDGIDTEDRIQLASAWLSKCDFWFSVQPNRSISGPWSKNGHTMSKGEGMGRLIYNCADLQHGCAA